MAGIGIFLCLVSAVLFIFTRKIFIKIKKNDLLKIEIHFPILALHLTERKGEKKAKKTKKRNYIAIYKIIRDAADTLDGCEVLIKSIELPLRSDPEDEGAFTKPLTYQAFIYSLLAYIDTKVQKLTLYSGAVISTDKASGFSCDITVKGRLYRLLYTLLLIYRRTRREGIKG